MNRAWLTAALLGATAACAPGDDYQPKVICHNANCVEPANPALDDTVDALRASLALERAGRPVLDGVEVDTFWFAEEGRCIFAHDLFGDTDVDAPIAGEVINEMLTERAAAGGPLTRTADTFSVFIELKGRVDTSGSSHTAAERASHAECAVTLGNSVAQAGASGNYAVEIVFTSFDPGLLTAVSASSSLTELRDIASVRIGALRGIPAPLDDQTRPLDAFDSDVDLVDANPQWVTVADRHAYASRNWDLAYWMFSITPETLDAIERDRPDWVTTSEANALTRWLDR